MIIDAILDRKACGAFTNDDVEYITDEAEIFNFNYIIDAFRTQDNVRIREALCKYIDEQNYNPEIKGFVNSVNWVPLGGVIYDRWER